MKILPKYMDWIGVVGNKNTTPALSVVSKWLPNASTVGRERVYQAMRCSISYLVPIMAMPVKNYLMAIRQAITMIVVQLI
jgi:hypothetical protein